MIYIPVNRYIYSSITEYLFFFGPDLPLMGSDDHEACVPNPNDDTSPPRKTMGSGESSSQS